MKSIWKFEIIDFTTIFDAPIVDFLSLQIQNGRPYLWATVDTNKPSERYVISVVGTGWDINGLENYRYLGTLQQGVYVWHYFINKLDI